MPVIAITILWRRWSGLDLFRNKPAFDPDEIPKTRLLPCQAEPRRVRVSRNGDPPQLCSSTRGPPGLMGKHAGLELGVDDLEGLVRIFVMISGFLSCA